MKEYEQSCRIAQQQGIEYRKHREIFSVQDPNRYAEEKQDMILSMQIVDVLFNDQDCTLVHINDQTSIYGKASEDLLQKKMIKTLIGIVSVISKPLDQLLITLSG